MKKLILILMICCLTKFAFSQDSTLVKYNNKFIGTWVAIQDSSIYEINLQIHDCKKNIVVGSVKKTTHSTLDFFWDIQYSKEEKIFYPLYGTMSDTLSTLLYMNYQDMQILQKGIIKLSINNKGNIITWELNRDKKYDLVSSRYPQTFKMPSKLIFTRKNK